MKHETVLTRPTSVSVTAVSSRRRLNNHLVRGSGRRLDLRNGDSLLMKNSDSFFNIVLKEAALFHAQLYVPETLDGL
jgi:hypothetical protein